MFPDDDEAACTHAAGPGPRGPPHAAARGVPGALLQAHRFGVQPQVVLHKGGDEEVGVVVALLHPHAEVELAAAVCGLKVFRLQLPLLQAEWDPFFTALSRNNELEAVRSMIIAGRRLRSLMQCMPAGAIVHNLSCALHA